MANPTLEEYRKNYIEETYDDDDFYDDEFEIDEREIEISYYTDMDDEDMQIRAILGI